MSNPRTGRRTAAPAPRTHVKVIVVHSTTQAVLDGASVTVTPVAPSRDRPQSGRTAKQLGFKTKKPVRPGDQVITVDLPGFGPVPAANATPTVGTITANVTVTAADGREKVVTIQAAQALARGAFLIGDANYNTVAPFWKAINGQPIPLIGAKIFLSPLPSASALPTPAAATATETGKTDIDGMFMSSFLQPGTYSVTVRKQGFKDYVDTITFSTPDDVLVHINLKNVFGRVNTNTIKVGGTAFVDWYNRTFRPGQRNQDDLHPIDKAGFDAVFNGFAPSAWDDPLTLEEFVAILLVMVVETGGKLAPVIEKFNPPELKYFFEPNSASGKASYNSSMNRRAGDQLLARKVLRRPADNALITAWNRPTPYPGPSRLVTEAAIRECDFYKYRGHGLIQVTWHDNYNTPLFVQAIVAKGHASLDACPTATFDNLLKTDPDVYRPLMHGWLLKRDKAFREVNERKWQSLRRAVNARSHHYDSYGEHCTNMIDAMLAAGPVLDPAMATPPTTP